MKNFSYRKTIIVSTLVFVFIISSAIFFFINTDKKSSSTKTSTNNELSYIENGISMLPTYNYGDTLYYKSVNADTNLNRGDLIIYNPGNGKPWLKRIIALPGDKFKISGGYVYINGEKVVEKYLLPESKTIQGNVLLEDQEITVPENKFIIMGDNRNVSLDSRDIGPVERSSIIGLVNN